jgi:DNA-binding transcriptional LysR family regulator
MRSIKNSDAHAAAAPSLDLRQLFYFLRVVECGSFTKAAADLHVAQPALSMAVRKLEENVGMLLLRREKNGITLTAEGEVLLAHARSILNSVQHARADLDAVRGLETGSTKIGIPPQFFSPALAALIVEFLDRYPGLRMDLVDAGATVLETMLADGQIDLAVLSENEIDPAWEAHLFLVDELGVVAARGHAILGQKTIDLDVLARYPMAVPSQGFWQRRVLERAFSTRNVRANIRFECAHIELLKAAVRYSGIVAPMVRGCITEDADLVWRGLSPAVGIRGYLCRRPDTVLSLANQALLSFFKERTPLGA